MQQFEGLNMMCYWSVIALIQIETYAALNRPRLEDLRTSGKIILEDTYNYKSDLNWTVHNVKIDDSDSYDYNYYEDYSEWEDLTGNDGYRSYQVCDSKTPDIHWLRSKYIKLPNNYKQLEITIEVDYSFPDCSQSQEDMMCEDTFNIYKYESSTDGANNKFPEWIESKQAYKKLKTIAAQDRFIQSDPDKANHISKETIRFKPSKSGFYVAFTTSKTCMALTRVVIHYYSCDALISGLSEFPESPAHSNSVKRIHGNCASNAVYVSLSKSDVSNRPIAYCDNDGNWLDQSVDQCQCRAGYQLNASGGMLRCEKCPINTYKEDVNGNCKGCPLNKESGEGSVYCKCKTGFRSESRTNVSDLIDKQCYQPAYAPVIVLQLISTSRVGFRIDTPLDKSELERLEYDISVCSQTTTSGGNYECAWKDHLIRYENSGGQLLEVKGLNVDTDYLIKIKASNIVTKTGDDFNVSVKKFRTQQDKPTRIADLKTEIFAEDATMQIQWPEIDATHYVLSITGPGKKESVYNVTEPIFVEHDLLSGKYTLEVYGMNGAGKGALYIKDIDVTIDDTMPIHMYAAAGAGGLLTVILIVIVSYCCCCKKKRERKYIKKPREEEASGLFGEKDCYPTALSPNSNGSRLLNNYEIGPEEGLLPTFDCMEINPIDIQVEKNILGEGEFAEVRKAYLVNKLSERMPVAAKQLKSGVGMRAQLEFIEEGQILQGFNHSSIIGLKGVVTKYRPLMILTEYMENGALEEFLKRNRGNVTVMEMIKILRDVSCGMEYLQSKGFIHRDLAARNILVDEYKNSKISDFGLSRLMDTAEDNQAVYMAHGGKVAIKWTAPESIKHKIFTHASDVWSFGVLCWEVMTYGDRPFWDMPNDEVIKSIYMGLRLPCPQGCPVLMHELMLNCWAQDPQRRPSFTQLREELESFLQNPTILNGNDGVVSESSTISYNWKDNRMSSFYTTLQ